jgi:Kdo2-lipid IVA lauroyltransferase/acyltransferase
MIRRRFKLALDAIIGSFAVGMLRTLKRMDRKRTANFAGALMRKLGPLFKEHRIGRDNLRAAFPEKSDVETEKILAGVWDNLGRNAVEFAHLDVFHIEGTRPTVVAADAVPVAPESRARYERIIKSGQGAICFAAHLANWELPGMAGKQLGGRTAILYRRPNIGAISDLVIELRAPLMGELVPTGLDAPLKLARLLQSGLSVGILADQHYTRGIEVTFFGRKCLANPLVARLAQQTDLPIYGVRVVRNPDGNSFWGEFTPQVEPVLDADGRVDVQKTTQAITSVIEGWVREHPEQWLWLHRRWR